MGSLFSPKVSAPPPPPPPPAPATVRDEIGGVEQIPVTNADGSVTYITRQIPLTAEQQAEQTAYKAIMTDALSEIQKLSSSDYTSDEGTQKILSAWEDERQKLLSNTFDNRARMEEKTLASRGLGDSSAAQSVRRNRRLDEQDAAQQLDRETDLLGEDIRAQRLATQQNLYNLSASQQDLQTAKALQSAARGQSMVSAVNSANRASIADYYSRQLGYSRFGSNSAGSMFSSPLAGMFSPNSGSSGGNGDLIEMAKVAAQVAPFFI